MNKTKKIVWLGVTLLSASATSSPVEDSSSKSDSASKKLKQETSTRRVVKEITITGEVINLFDKQAECPLLQILNGLVEPMEMILIKQTPDK